MGERERAGDIERQRERDRGRETERDRGREKLSKDRVKIKL